LEATRQIMYHTPVPIVIVSSQYETSDVALSFSILKAGALTILPRPVGPMHPDYRQSARSYRNTLRMMAGIRVTAQRKIPPASPSTMVAKRFNTTINQENRIEKPRILAIGASAGGPQALQSILSLIPVDFTIPIVIVQHIDPNFASGFCDWLNLTSAVPVHIASDGDKILPGHAYLPPGDSHLGVVREGFILVSKEPPERNLRPSVSFLFRSIAMVYGKNAIAVLLSGMGADGAKELKHLRDLGVITMAQDELSSLVHGMPGEAIRMGAACVIAPPEDIAREIIKNTKN
ncbi:MAG: chemotaxis protein CheB, partial [Mariniphaga sp.]